MEYAVEIIGGKWKLRILWMLSHYENMRFNELRRQISGVTDVMLTQCLKELAADGMVNRVQYNEVPPRVEYSLTEEGRRFIPVLKEVANWSLDRLARLQGGEVPSRISK